MIMLILAVLLLVVSIGLFAVKRPEVPRGAAPIALIAAAVLAILSCIRIVDSGRVGVKRIFGKVDLEAPLTEGISLVNPLVNIQEMSIRTEVYTMSAAQREGRVVGDDSIVAISSDDLKCPLDVSVAYRLTPAAAPWVFQNLGPNYATDLVRASIRTGVRSAAKEYTAAELRGVKRDDAAEAMQTKIQGEIDKILATYEGPPENAIVISNALLRNVGIPDKVRLAIEEKLSADQRAQQMEFEILKAEKEKEKMQKEGEAIDNYNVAASKNLTEDLLRLRGIEATRALAESPNTKVIIIGGKDGLPLILNASDSPGGGR